MHTKWITPTTLALSLFIAACGSDAGDTTDTKTETPTPTAPAAPSQLVATFEAATTQVTLRWTDNGNDESGFTIQRGVDGSERVYLADVAANITQFADTEITGGVTYAYSVAAFNEGGQYSAYATAVTVVVPEGVNGSSGGGTSSGGGNSSSSSSSGGATLRAPNTVLITRPSDITSNPDIQIEYTADIAGATFYCSFTQSAASYEPCSSTYSAFGVADGTYHFKAYAVHPDSSILIDESPISFTFTVDTGAPAITVTPFVVGLTADTGATFGSTSATNVEFQVAIEDATLDSSKCEAVFRPAQIFPQPQTQVTFQQSPCPAIVNLTGLENGQYTFTVEASDRAANTTTVQRTFIVDQTAPATPTYASGTPDGASIAVSTTTVTFRVRAFDDINTEIRRLDCDVDGATTIGTTEGVALDGSNTLDIGLAICGIVGLSEGSHELYAWSLDTANNRSGRYGPHIITVDTIPPTTTIQSGPPAMSNETTATITFTSNDATATYECFANGTSVGLCGAGSGGSYTFVDLMEGNYTFEIIATDAAGNIEETRKAVTTTVDLPVETYLDSASVGARTAMTDVTFMFHGSSEATGFVCSIDGGGFTVCTSPADFYGLDATGIHTFAVSAHTVDNYYDPAPAQHSWTRVEGWSEIAVGTDFICGTRNDTSLWCWGKNSSGQLGLGDQLDRTATTQFPGTAVAPALGWSSIVAGDAHACGIVGGFPYCWGAAAERQLGPLIAADTQEPTFAADGEASSQLSSGRAHVCSLRPNGEIWCWGSAAYGQLGHGLNSNTFPTARQEALGKTWTIVDAGGDSNCAIDTGGVLYCWGANGRGQLGIGSTNIENTPQQVTTDTDWMAISVGDENACAIKTNGTLHCWGANMHGQLLTDTTNASCTGIPCQTVPWQIDGATDWVDVSVGKAMICARNSSNQVYCSGRGMLGQLGDGNAADSGSWVQVNTTLSLEGPIAVGADNACATETSGAMFCWGSNANGQLGRPLDEAPASCGGTACAVSPIEADY